MLLDALSAVLDVWVLVAALAGIVIGIVVGAIPGLGPTVAIALLIPVTFSMPTVPAITLLLGVYQGAIFGGSISAILMNVPGTPSSAATAIDGFAMARAGKGARALRVALFSSVTGNVISCIFLILLAEPLASFALHFGPAEMAMLLLFALTTIVLFGAGRPLEAAIMVLVGMLVGVVGLDPIEGTPRFTFGSFELENGFQLIPVLVGAFALAELFYQLFTHTKQSAPEAEVVSNTSQAQPFGFIELWRMRITLLWSSLIGTFVGILPGVGSTVPAFMSYSLVRSRSKQPETFGEGAEEGVAAPEAANNAVTGGALIPTLALGIPGDAVTAVVLGAFMLQGLAPGPFLFRDYGVEVYAIFIVLILSAVPTIILGLMLFKVATRVMSVKAEQLFPVVAILALLGAFSVNNSLTDVAVMLGAGALGFLFRLGGFAIPPLLIGLILGAPFEQSIRQTLLASDGNLMAFLDSSISIGLFVIVLLSLGFACVSAVKAKRGSEKGASNHA